MDLLYIENCSILLDLQLMLLTARALLLPSSTQGFARSRLFAHRESAADRPKPDEPDGEDGA